MASKRDVQRYIERKFGAVMGNIRTKREKAVSVLNAEHEREMKEATEKVKALATKAGITFGGYGSDAMVSIGVGYARCKKSAEVSKKADAELDAVARARDALIDECLISGSDPAFIAKIEAALKKFS